jgi:hypothetical protein
MMILLFRLQCRQFEQTFSYVERVATTKSQSDLEILTMELDE